MKATLNYLGAFGLVVLPIAFGLLVLGAYWLHQVMVTGAQIGE